MTKRSGYSIRISAFIEASPTDMQGMQLAISAIDAACEALRQDGFQMVTHRSRFMLSREVADVPVAEQYTPEQLESLRASAKAIDLDNAKRVVAASEMPTIPAHLDASKRGTHG